MVADLGGGESKLYELILGSGQRSGIMWAVSNGFCASYI